MVRKSCYEKVGEENRFHLVNHSAIMSFLLNSHRPKVQNQALKLLPGH
jgi:hypothetical protein